MIPKQLRKALEEFEFSEAELSKLHLNSDLFSDLGLYGDTFAEFFPILVSVYGNEPEFPWARIPGEFSADGMKIDARNWPRIFKTIMFVPKSPPSVKFTLAELHEIFSAQEIE